MSIRYNVMCVDELEERKIKSYSGGVVLSPALLPTIIIPSQTLTHLIKNPKVIP